MQACTTRGSCCSVFRNIAITQNPSPRAGTYDPKKLLGVTKLDVVRAQQFIGEIAAVDPAGVSVPVIGGHAGVTILPLLSQVNDILGTCQLPFDLAGANVRPLLFRAG